MFSLQVEIELGLLTSKERKRRDWFPEWFTYSITETEKRNWNDYLEKNPLKWTEENDLDEDGEHAYEKTGISTTMSGQGANTLGNDIERGDSSSKSDQEENREEPVIVHNEKPVSKGPESASKPDPKNTDRKDNTASEVQDSASKEPQGLSESSEKKCAVCGKPGKLCTGCKTVAYCGKEHQKEDWKQHKAVCKGKGSA